MKILYVEDNPQDADLTRRELARSAPHIQLTIATSLSEAYTRLVAPATYNLVLTDLRLPDGSGLDLLTTIREKALPVAVVILTGLGDEETAVAALKSGVDDYLIKRADYLSRLPQVLETALARFHAEATRRTHPLRVLYLEHNATDLDLTRRHMTRFAPHIRLDAAHTVNEVLHRLSPNNTETGQYDLLLLDYRLPGLNALELLKTLHDERKLDLPVVLITGQGNEEVAVQALRLGAADYLVKHSGYLYKLPAALENAYYRAQLAREQAALRESEARYRALFENEHTVMLLVNPVTAEFIDANPAACAYYGWSRAEFQRMRVNDLNISSNAEIMAMLQQANAQKHQQFTTKHRLANGQIRNVEIYSGPIQLAGQSLLYSIVHDITERVKTEAALQASEEYFRALIANASDVVTVLEADGTIRYISPSVKRVLGYDPAELIGQTAFNLISPDDLKAVQTTFQRILRAPNQLQTLQFKVRHHDGLWRIADSIGCNLLDNSAVHGIVVNSRDITGRKELEEQFQQAQKMESVGRLAGGIAHDFNNLLVPILGFTELSMLSLRPDSILYANLSQVKQAGERAADLTRQILAFSRRQVLEIKNLNLNTVISDFQKMTQRLIGEDIELNIVLEPALRPINADKSQLEQILLNLVVNARDAMPNGGKLTLETANVFLDRAYAEKHPVMEPGRYVMLAVSDCGHGMDAETKNRIFEPFFTTKEQGKGTGLGLATVFGIVKQHKGHIWVYSETGKGTTFKIYLPPSTDELQAIVDNNMVFPSVYGSETVLIVEDEEMVRTLVSETLEAYGYHVLVSPSPDEGFQFAATYPHTIHLLLTDVIMPQTNGLELHRKLVKYHPEMKVVFMSGYASTMIAQHGIFEEGVNFLQKPFTINALLQKVRSALN